MGNPNRSAASRVTTVKDEFSLSAFEHLVVQLMATSDVTESDSPVARAMLRFLSRHKAYCGGYILKHLGMAQWGWTISSTCSPDDSANVSVEIRYDGDDEDGVMDLLILVSVPPGCLRSCDFFDDRIGGRDRERAIYLVFRDALQCSATQADLKDFSHLPDQADV